MANHARDDRGVADKRAALTSGQHRAYNHGDQVGGSMRREADGRWVKREPEPEPARPRVDKRETPIEFLKRNIVYILSVVAVIVIAVLLIFGVRMVSDLFAPASVEEEEQYENPYDWDNLEQVDGRYAYVVNGQVKSRLGIDVADYQSYIDWDAVASDGIDFAIVRLGYRGSTEGGLYLDDYFEYNLAGARAAGLDCGVYFFSQAVTVDEAIEEAEFVLANLDGAKLEYPIAFDSETVSGLGETRTAGLTDDELSEIADAFCARIERAGYQTLVYGNSWDLRSYDIDVMTGRGIWWAEYGAKNPSQYMDIVMWQYSSEGHVAGIENTVDMNIDLSGVLS